MPNTAKGGGISRKIINHEERNQIRKMLREIEIPKSMGLIVRTAGSRKSQKEIQNDLDAITAFSSGEDHNGHKHHHLDFLWYSWAVYLLQV